MRSPEDLQAQYFNDSLERCMAQPGFIERFYDFFTSVSPEISVKFARTDFRRQTRMLKMSLHMILVASTDVPEASVHLARIAEQHSSRDLDIPPEMYTIWLDSLIRAAREFDHTFDEKTELAWRAILQPGIDFMISRY